MTFNLIELDTCPTWGWVVGFGSEILVRDLKNGAERRNDETDELRHIFTLPHVNITDPFFVERIKRAYAASRMTLYPFLAKDYMDFRHGFEEDGFAPMQFAIADGVTTRYRLSKTYVWGSRSWARPITKPQPGHVILAEGVDSGFTASLYDGWVDFGSSIPDEGTVLAWLGEYRVPVRFADFTVQASIDNKFADGDYAVNVNCQLIEVPKE